MPFGTHSRPVSEYGGQIVHSKLDRDRGLLQREQEEAAKQDHGLSGILQTVRLADLDMYTRKSKEKR